MVNCIIIHGSPSDDESEKNPETRTYNKHWIPWTKKTLEEKGIETQTPLMPNPWEPIYEDYERVFSKFKVNEQTVLVGTSAGCAFLVNWLGKNKIKVKKLILVAPWKVNSKKTKYFEKFYGFKINPQVNNLADEIVAFTSDNEREDGKKSLRLYEEVLNMKIIELKNHGHYIMKDMGKEELPELISEII